MAKKTNNNPQNTTQKIKDQATQTPQLNAGGLRCSEGLAVPAPDDNRRVIVKRHGHHLIWKSCWTPVCVNKYKNINKT
jgi:hypothetical protein